MAAEDTTTARTTAPDTTGTGAGDFMPHYHRRNWPRGHGRRPSWDYEHGLVPFEDDGYYPPYTRAGAAFFAMSALDNWRLRGKYYSDYYRNTGKKPRYYSNVSRRRIKW